MPALQAIVMYKPELTYRNSVTYDRPERVFFGDCIIIFIMLQILGMWYILDLCDIVPVWPHSNLFFFPSQSCYLSWTNVEQRRPIRNKIATEYSIISTHIFDTISEFSGMLPAFETVINHLFQTEHYQTSLKLIAF